MNCKHKHRKTEDRAKNRLLKENAIDKYLNILDLKKFRNLNKTFRDHGKLAYDIDEQWFYEENGGKKALPNKDAFRRADAKNGVFFQKGNQSNDDILDSKIEKQLKSFLTKYGIGLEFVDSLKERGYDAVAMVDMVNKLITVAKGEADATTLPEEVAHVAVELLGEDNPLIKKLMNSIEGTEVYNEVYEEYKGDPLYMERGKPNIKKIKKEAIGKAISKQILGVKTNPTFIGTIKLIWNKILKIFKRADVRDLNKEVDKLSNVIAKDILKDTLKGDVNNLTDGVFFQKSTVEKKNKAVKKAELSIKTLKVRKLSLERKNKEGSVDEHKMTISNIEDAIVNNEAVSGIAMYVEHASLDTQKIQNKIDDYLIGESSLTITPSFIQDMGDFLDTHGTTVNDLISFFSFDSEFKEKGEYVLIYAKELANQISEIAKFYEHIKKQKTLEIIEQSVHSKSDFNPEKLYEETSEDTSWFRNALLSLKHAKSEVLRIVYDKVETAENKLDEFTDRLGRELINAKIELEKSGFKDFNKFYEKDNKGKKTGRLIGMMNYGIFYQDINKVKENIASKLGYDNYSEIEDSNLDAYQIQLKKNMWKTFYKSALDRNGNPNNNYINKIYKELSIKEGIFLDKLKKVKLDALSKLPASLNNARNVDKLPQMRKSSLDRLKSMKGGVLENIKKLATENLSVKEDDIEYGDISSLVNPITNKVHDLIPIHYNNNLNNFEDISDDLVSMYISYANMAENFRLKSEIAPELSLIKDAVGERGYVKGSTSKQGIETNTYKMLSTFMDTHVYGKKTSKHEMKFRGKVILDKNSNPRTWEKLADTLNSYVRRNNLVFNAFTHVANYTMGSIFSKIEDAAGVYTTQESKIWAEMEIDANLPGILAQIGGKVKTNKVAALYEYNNVNHGTLNHFKNLNSKNNAGRILMGEGLYSTYAIGDYRVKGKIMLAMYDNFRLIDGKYMKRNEVYLLYKEDKQKGKKVWSDAKGESLYNAYEVKNGIVTIKPEFSKYVTKNLERRLKNSINQVTDQVDGKLSSLDRSSLHRNAIGRLVLTHRSWLLTGLEARWKDKTFNYSTEEWEEGYHKTFGRNVLLGIIKNKGNFISMIKNWDNLSPLEQSNTKKAWADVLSIALILFLSSAIQNLADDDDDESTQMLAYMFTRFELESRAFSNPFEVMSMFKSPAAGINQVESIMNGLGMLVNWDSEDGTWGPNQLVKSGSYKNYTKAERLLIKRSFAKNFFALGDSKNKNRYLRSQVL